MSTSLHPTADAFDEWADQQLERLRGNRVTDTVFHMASHLGDMSLIWHIAGVARAVPAPRGLEQAAALSALLGAESLLVNQGVKRLFRRTRPTTEGDPRFPVRKPSTSSFPSGHASSAVFAATLLTVWGGKRTAPLWFSIAGVVAVSRAYVRIHHASDVVGGAVLGAGLGLAAAPIARRLR
jgi:undecaprenyl-diphosphatase